MDEAGHQPAGVEGERGAVLPPLAERRLDVVDRRPLDRHLDVVPGGGRAVGPRQVHRLPVAVVLGVVAPAVAQVDAADVGDVAGRVLGVPDHDELLVVGAAGADPHVPQALAAGLADLLAELAVPMGAEAETVPVGAPQQPTDVDAAAYGVDQGVVERGPGVVGQLLVGVALPVGEVEAVARAECADALVELLEVVADRGRGPGRCCRCSTPSRHRARASIAVCGFSRSSLISSHSLTSTALILLLPSVPKHGRAAGRGVCDTGAVHAVHGGAPDSSAPSDAGGGLRAWSSPSRSACWRSWSAPSSTRWWTSTRT